MKKIFLLLIIALWQLSCMAIELTEVEIMPKKLLFAELPEDYPPEINELFDFYYQICKDLYARIDECTKMLDVYSIYEDFANEFSHDEIRRFVYLEWLANKHLKEYFWEFHDLHDWLSSSDVTHGFLWNELLPYKDDIKKLIYHPYCIEEVAAANEAKRWGIWLSYLRSYLWDRYNYEMNEIQDFSMYRIRTFNPLYGKVISITPLSDNGDYFKKGGSSIRDYLYVQVDNGQYIQPILIASFHLSQPTVGNTYLFFLSPTPLQERIYSNRVMGTPLNSYGLGGSLIVENGIINPRGRVHTYLTYFLDEKELDSEQKRLIRAHVDVTSLRPGDILDRPERFYKTPLDVFWERYNHFHKRILEGK
jgi:hypothetical protein